MNETNETFKTQKMKQVSKPKRKHYYEDAALFNAIVGSNDYVKFDKMGYIEHLERYVKSLEDQLNLK